MAGNLFSLDIHFRSLISVGPRVWDTDIRFAAGQKTGNHRGLAPNLTTPMPAEVSRSPFFDYFFCEECAQVFATNNKEETKTRAAAHDVVYHGEQVRGPEPLH